MPVADSHGRSLGASGADNLVLLNFKEPVKKIVSLSNPRKSIELFKLNFNFEALI
jgi:hypothetical protein